MRKFKDLLSLIVEAKFEPGGPDVGKLFGERGKYAPKKGPKENTAQQRLKSGELTPNVNRPSGLETSLERYPPEGAQFIEPTAKQRASGKKIIDRTITPEHPGIPEPTKKPEQTNREVVLFTNNANHSILGTNNKKISKFLQKTYPKFVEHSNRLTGEHANNINSYSTEHSRRTSAHRVVDSHFADLEKQIRKSSTNDVLPNNEKFGTTKIRNIESKHDFDGTRTLQIHFEPFKTHIESALDIKTLINHLSKHTSHEWYIHPDSGNWMVGKADSPLILATDINHPDLGDPDDDRGGGNEPETTKPPKIGGGAPSRPRTPSLV